MRSPIFSCLASLFLGASAFAADPVAELSSFSVFNNIDLAQLAKGGVKTAHGPQLPNPRYLSVQSCYIVPGPPAPHLEAIQRWTPLAHRELRVWIQQDVPARSPEATFAKIKSAPDNSATRAFTTATTKMSNDLQLSRAEAAKWNPANANGGLGGGVGDFWMGVLAGRARAFTSGGTSALAPYDHSSPALRAGDELNGLLREQGNIRKQFGSFLDGTGIGRGAGSIRADQYWQLQQVDDSAAVTLGAFYSRNSATGAQGADVTYYASGGFYTGLSLYQLWPVEINGQPSTLVWRGDMTSSGSLAGLHGMEKLASESAMMKDVGRAVNLLLKDTAR
ncbi:MAG: hypothetical protein ABI839_00780 [Verrucomicrobiota bacterium]